eukprot:SM000139S00130  [mRNA]  locus=s139:332144:335094:+ [translate_table: standard]
MVATQQSEANPASLDYVTFTLIVDDIVFPDGRTSMACLGGGGAQTAFGMRLLAPQDRSIGLAAGVGADLPGSCWEWLSVAGINTQGLVRWPQPTLRAWQVTEKDGQRTQVRTIADTPTSFCGVPQPSQEPTFGKEELQLGRVDFGSATGILPTKITSAASDGQAAACRTCRTARAYHAGVHPSGRDVPFVRQLRASGAAAISIETYTHATEPVPLCELRALLQSTHIFSPNEKEAWSLVGPGAPLEVIARLVELGAEVVSLRRGELGCVVHRADTGETWEVPAYHVVCLEGGPPPRHAPREVGQQLAKPVLVDDNWGSYAEEKRHAPAEQQVAGKDRGAAVEAVGTTPPRQVVDTTGCGNAFCGGFLAGWVEERNLLTAALWGSVAASFMAEYQGVPPPAVTMEVAEAQRRVHLLSPFACQLAL